MDFNFHMPAHVISGKNCLINSKDQLNKLGKRCVIITGRSGAKASGALDDAIKALELCNIKYKHFYGITANPLLTQCQAAAFEAQDSRADFVIGIGGGSVMDATKAAAWLASNDVGDTQGLMDANLTNNPLPTVLIGTTAGTGSEVSAVSVLTMPSKDGKAGRKQSVTDPRIFADLVFADPKYTYSANLELTITSALDAFAHVVEGWFAPACQDVITVFAKKALEIVSSGLYVLAKGGIPQQQQKHDDLREILYYGSLWAGMVLCATGTGFPHPMGYVLTEDYNVPHGMACAVYLPEFLRRAKEYSPQRANQLFGLCGGEDKVFEMLNTLINVDVSMTSAQIDSYAERWKENSNFKRSPGNFTKQDAKLLLNKLFLNS